MPKSATEAGEHSTRIEFRRRGSLAIRDTSLSKEDPSTINAPIRPLDCEFLILNRNVLMLTTRMLTDWGLTRGFEQFVTRQRISMAAVDDNMFQCPDWFYSQW